MDRIVEVSHAAKRYRQHRRFPGMVGAVRTLFTREFTEVAAVTDVSFEIKPGEAVGYLGPNGAGKSTMIKMMTGILVPTAGTVHVLGRTPHLDRSANAREIGVVFGQRSQLWWDLPVIDSFALNQRIYDIDKRRYRDNLDRFVSMLELAPFLDRPVRKLSLGQRMRCELVMALLHDPRILFLDEPTIGLDVVAKDSVRRFLASVNRERGLTIILTTHDMVDIEEICPRLIMVDQSRLIYDGPLRELRLSLGSRRRVHLEFATDPGPIALRTARLANDDGVRKSFVIDSEAISLMDVLGELDPHLDIKDVVVEEPGIEELIRGYYIKRAAGAS